MEAGVGWPGARIDRWGGTLSAKLMKRTRDQILKTLEENRQRLRSLGVRRIGLFGSAARDSSGQRSDLDFLVELEHKSFDTYMDLKEFLEVLFQCPVDLVLPETLKPRLRKSILQDTVYASRL